MASNPPFEVEETDEDFFDNLVVDDDGIVPKDTGSSAVVVGSAFADGNESDEAKAFANLSIGEVNGNGDNANDTGFDESGSGETRIKAIGELGGVVEGEVRVARTVSGNVDESSGSIVAGQSVGVDSVIESNHGNTVSETSSNCTMISKSGSGGSGIKEVDWSAFNADTAQDDGNAFGSYSDFFTGLEENAAHSVGNLGMNVNVESKVVSRNGAYESGHFGDSNNYAQYQETYGYGAATENTVAGQEVNSILYWENLYPGWKYDPFTGQWHQVDGYDASAIVQGNVDSSSAANWSASDGKSEVSYLQQTAQSLTETIAESARTESVTNWNQVSQVNGTTEAISNWNLISQGTENAGLASDWNQVSQVNNGYPSHMIFDPQYPGWYYDTVAQEWCPLDSYNAYAQLIVQASDQLNQNGFPSSETYTHNNNQNTYGANVKVQNTNSQAFSSQAQDFNWAGSFNNYNQQASSVWQPGSVAKSESLSEYGRSQLENNPARSFSESNYFSQQETIDHGGAMSAFEKANQGQNNLSAIAHSRSFASSGNFNQQFNEPNTQQIEQKHISDDLSNQNSVSFTQQLFHAADQYSYAPAPGRSSAGRPPHALVTFGFGGKLIVMKDYPSYGNLNFGSQNSVGCTVSVLNLAEVVGERADASSAQPGVCDYFHALRRQSFPGPLTGGSVSAKELNKWIDERISSLEYPDMDFRKSQALKLLLSLLKIACQHYGKLRSPFGTDTVLKENDLPESAIAKLFASVKRNGAQYSQYGTVAHCLQSLPSEGQMQATAAEVQGLLVSGRKKEALVCAQQGQLWGPALVLAAQLGDQFYVDTVKQMALRQLVAGSPLRTLCLLIAGQPADVFSADTMAGGSMPGFMSTAQQPSQLGANGMLDDWEENLAMIAANRTKDDELVLIHLGDCLWKERSDTIAAHVCYLVAEANVEPYSDSARLCLVGADHWKFPRTYASPEAIQRTEIYEYSKVIGNSQFILFPFQPYRLVYAHMLAEVGRTSDALKYCQAVLKSLKTGRSTEVETLRQLASSLEERIKTHQQGGFSSNLASAKLVGKLLNLFDGAAHRVVGGLPPPIPSTSGSSVQGNEHPQQSMGRVSTSQSTMAMSSLMPSASMEPISEWAADGSRKPKHNRSISEPDFGRSPRQDQVGSSKESSSAGKSASRFGRFGFGSQLLQRTVGLVLRPRQERQAKLGEKNKFYYDEKLKMWVEEGAEPPAEVAAPPPPPTTAAFQNGISGYNVKTALKSEGPFSNGTPEFKSPPPVEHSSGMPPLPPTSNQFSARGRMGVRSRYVDTFNQGGGNPTNLFQSPSVPSVKPAGGPNPKFFVPAPLSSIEQPNDSAPDNVAGLSATDGNPSVATINESIHLPASSSPVTMQRFASMDNISSKSVTGGNSSLSANSRRTASWSGSFNDSLNPPERTELKPLGEVLGIPPSSFLPTESLVHSSVNGGSFSDDLHEVEL